MWQIKYIFFKILMVVSIIAMSSYLYAQDSTYQETLKDIKITGAITPGQARSSTPVQTITNKQFEQMNSLSVADASKYFSGVQIKDYGGIGGLKTISVRSLGAEHTGILFDGFAINDAQNGQTDLGKFPLEIINKISLYNAQGLDLLQSARSYSFASLLQLKTEDTSINNKNNRHYSASFKTGSFGLFNPSATIKNKSKNIYSSFHADYLNANGVYKFSYQNANQIIQDRRKNSDVEALNLLYNAHFRLKDSSSIHSNIYYYHAQRGLPGAIILYNPQGSQRLWDKNFFLQSSWSKKLNKQMQLLLAAKYNYSYFRYLDTTYLNAERRLENIFRQNEYYTSGVFVYTPFRILKLAYATDYFINDITSNNKDFDKPVRYNWLNNISAQLSVNKWSLHTNLLASYIQDRRKDINKNRVEYTPSVALSYTIEKENPFIIRAFYKKIFRMPTFNDLYYTHVGNTNLRPEFVHQYNLGIAHEKQINQSIIQKINFSADIFYNNATDKIVAVPTGNIGQWSMQNIGKATIKGAEASGNIDLEPIAEWLFSLRGNYTYQQAQAVSNPASAVYKNQIAYIPLHSGSYNFLAVQKNISIGYNALFSGYRYTGHNSAFTYMPAWNTHDISFSYKKHTSAIWKIFFELNNIFNEQYAIVNYFPMPGRSFRTGIKFFK